ncbi:phosphotransacetylase family protein [Candidatus Thorarchaeota archaeon]|nr:MAG: phosphotransacetylase family protein [Candidatus Thorarchaeota archaeon]
MMAKNIVISGDTVTGKTMVAIGLAGRLKAKGKSIAYFKPSGTKSYIHSTSDEDVDEDAALMKELLGMNERLSCICPIVRHMSSFDELLRVGNDALLTKIQTCYQRISKDKDFVLIEGTKSPWNLLHVGLSTPEIAKLLDATVICLVNFPDIEAIDDILMQKNLFTDLGIEKLGIVLSMVPPMLKKTVNESIRPWLESQGVAFCGVLYNNRELFSPTVGEILRALDGEMIIGSEKMDLLIDQFIVGSMAPENALKWFRRSKDMAVITSGDRTDICLAALETDTNLLILTGGLGPEIGTVTRARELGVPIMMTALDTYGTSKIVDDLLGTVTVDNKEKIAAVERIVGEALHLEFLEL